MMEVKQRTTTQEGEPCPYRREKAREVAERVLLADGSNQHSASVQLVSARQDHSSTAAGAPDRLLRTGGGGEKGQRRQRGSVQVGEEPRTGAQITGEIEKKQTEII